MAVGIRPESKITLAPAPFDISDTGRDDVNPRFSLVRIPRTAPSCTVRQAMKIIKGMVKDEF